MADQATQQSAQVAEIGQLRQQGNEAFKKSQYDSAIELYSKALRLTRSLREVEGEAGTAPAPAAAAGGSGGSGGSGAAAAAAAAGSAAATSGEGGVAGAAGGSGAVSLAEEEATLCSNRSAAFASLCRQYLSRPAARSESSALFGLEPGHLAALALADAQKAVSAKPSWPKAHHRLGVALYLSERYPDAQAAYLAGLTLDPTNKPLQESLAEMTKELQSEEEEDTTPTPAAAAAGSRSMRRKRPRVLASSSADDFECILCLKLLFEPVTTACGHTFCQACFARASDHSNKCPVCRTVLHIGRNLPVTRTLANIISKAFPQEYATRASEEAEARLTAAAAGAQGGGAELTLPLFVMSTIMPGERMSLNIFEPRYRLMVRRAMEGNRRIGMAQVRPGSHELEQVAVEAEVTECIAQPDGRYHLELVGRRRVEVLSSGELDGYRTARCRVFNDEPTPPPAAPAAGGAAGGAGGAGGAGAGADAAGAGEEVARLAGEVAVGMDRAVTGLRAWTTGVGGRGARGARARECLERAGPRPPADKPEALSFWAGALLVSFSPDLDYSDRTQLLTMRNTAERLRFCNTHLQRMATVMGGAAAGAGGGGAGGAGQGVGCTIA